MLCCGILQLISPCHCNIAAMFRCTNCLQINEALHWLAGALQLGPGWDGEGEARTLSCILSDGDTWSWRHRPAGSITPTGGQHVSSSSCAILQPSLPSCTGQTIPYDDLNHLICVYLGGVLLSGVLLHSLDDPWP